MSADTGRVEARIRGMRDGRLKQALVQVRDGTAQVVSLGGSGLGSERCEWLCTLLRSNSSVTALDVSDSRLYAPAAAALAAVVAKDTPLLWLDASRNFLGGRDEYGAFLSDPAAAAALCSALATNAHLVHLSLRHTRLFFASARALARSLERNRVLASLDLGSTALGLRGAAAIGSALRHNAALRRVRLGNRWLPVQLLRGVSVGDDVDCATDVSPDGGRTLVLSGPATVAADVVLTSSLLASNTRCETLDLAGAEVTRDGFTALADALAVNTSLRELLLSDCHAMPRDAELLAESLARPTCPLQTLLLSDARLPVPHLSGTSGRSVLSLRATGLVCVDAVVIGRLLSANTSLTRLDLSKNDIASGGDVAGIFAMAEALSTNETLRHLDLTDNVVGFAAEEAVARITSALKFNSLSCVAQCGVHTTPPASPLPSAPHPSQCTHAGHRGSRCTAHNLRRGRARRPRR